MSRARGHGWPRRGKHSVGSAVPADSAKEQAAQSVDDFAVDIYLDSEDGVTSWPTGRDDTRQADISDGGTPVHAEPSQTQSATPTGDRPDESVEAEPPEEKRPDGPLSAIPTPPVTPPVAAVIGSVQTAQIVVGTGSPEVEPAVISEQFRSFPFRPDTVVDGWSTELVTIRGASLRGHLHRYNGAPRQDDFAVHRLGDGRLIALVADGVSESPQAHLGATAAVRAASRWLMANTAVLTAETDWLALMKDAAWALAEQARVTFQLSDPDPQMALEELSTTLLCAVIESSSDTATLSASVVSIGDSGAWLLSGGEFKAVLGGKTAGEGGISSSAVSGLPQVPAELHATAVEIRPGDVLLLGTDGFGDPLGNGSGGVGNLFRELLDGSNPPSIVDFARALDFSRETFDDDRTLVAVIPRVPDKQS